MVQVATAQDERALLQEEAVTWTLQHPDYYHPHGPAGLFQAVYHQQHDWALQTRSLPMLAKAWTVRQAGRQANRRLLARRAAGWC